jgi:hypothetical protein
MREKAAAAAMSLKKDKGLTTSTTSKPILASAGKRHPPLKINSQQVDQLGATMKQQPSISKKPSDVQSPIDTYEISDREDSGTDDSGSESDNDKQKKKNGSPANVLNKYGCNEKLNSRLNLAA